MDNNVEEIKTRLDIVDIISGYIKLTPAGMANFKANCPFHNEKTPSFLVSRDKQIFKCFGCGKGGDIFSFVMEMEGVEFKEALRILAGKAGITLKKEDPKFTSKRNNVLDCLDSASRFFYQVLLNASHAKNALDYLKKRQINDDTIDLFKLGYAPNTWDSLYNALRKKGFYANDIESAGLIIKKQQSNDYYDRFRNRIMFPIQDINGNVIGFSGRILESEQENIDAAKYINTPQTIAYDKSKILYGLDKAKQEIRKNDLAVLVEGQMDVIACHQAEFKNTIASSGTALTAEQIKIIKRYTNNIALSFDMDEAGKTAAKRAVELALAADMNIKIINIPEAKDPDECIRNNSKNWANAVKNAPLFLDYYFDETLLKTDIKKAEDKKNAAKTLLSLIAKIGDPIVKSHYIKKLSKILDVDESILNEILETQKKPAYETNKVSEPKANEKIAPKNKDLKIAERIIALGLIYFENFPYLSEHLLPVFLLDDNLNSLYKQLIIYYTTNKESMDSSDKKFNYTSFKAGLCKTSENPQLLEYLDELWLYGEKEILDYKENGETPTPQKIKLEIEDGIFRLKEEYHKYRLKLLQTKIQEAEKEKNENKIEELSREVNRIMMEIKK